jgi:hypothetical protein
MRTPDLFSSLFWFVFSIYVLIESYRLGLGKWDEPGPGYFPLGAALLLGVTALSVMVKAMSKISEREVSPVPVEKSRWQKVPMVLFLMLLYSLGLKTMGFVLCTLLLYIFFLKMVMPQPWVKTIAVALSVTLGAYLLFNVFLKAQLPMGILSF